MGHKLNNAVIKQLHTATTIIFVRDPIATHVAKESITHTQQFYPMIRAQHIALGTVSYVRPSKRIESMARGVYVANIFFLHKLHRWQDHAQTNRKQVEHVPSLVLSPSSWGKQTS